MIPAAVHGTACKSIIDAQLSAGYAELRYTF